MFPFPISVHLCWTAQHFACNFFSFRCAVLCFGGPVVVGKQPSGFVRWSAGASGGASNLIWVWVSILIPERRIVCGCCEQTKKASSLSYREVDLKGGFLLSDGLFLL